MRRKYFGRKVSAAVLALSSVLSINMAPLAGAAVDMCTWTGGGADELFSNALNWTGCDNSNVPEAGDALKFTRLASSNSNTIQLTNDLGVAFSGLIIDADTPVQGTYFEIDTLQLANNAIVESTGTGPASGSGGLSVKAAVLQGVGNVTFTNTTAGGYSYFQTYDSAITIAGNLTLQPNTSASLNTSNTVGGLIVQDDASAYFFPTTATSSFTVPITLGGGTGVSDPSLSFGCFVMSQECATTTWNISSAINLTSSAKFEPSQATTVNVTGALSGAGAITKSQYAWGVLNINPSSNTSQTATGTLRNAVKTTAITDEQPTASYTVIDNETATLDGKRGYVDVYPGGKLLGAGTATGGIYVAKGGVIAPGHSPGCINSGDLALNGTYEFEVGGAAACTGYDQINVTGTVDITGATLGVSIFNNYAPVAGGKYVIVANDGTEDVTGTFAGLAEGATFAVGDGGVFRISYKGGTGNDIELTVVTAPAVPDTGIEILMANPLLTLTGAVIGAGALMVAARRVRA